MRKLLSIWKWILPPLLLAPAATLAQARLTLPLDGDWQFRKADHPAWQTVSLPHSFNADDGASPSYYRGAAWYRRSLTLPRQQPGRRHYLEFDGAMLVTDVWINGRHAGRHAGGFARFRFDVTRWLKTGRNTLEVRVDNSINRNVPPLGGDYTMAGGLYRQVRLVTTGAVHFDMLDYGGPGVYFNASGVSSANASLQWTARVANTGSRTVRTIVTVRLRDAGRRVVATARKAVSLPPHSVTAVVLRRELASPRLWQGARDPYLYTSVAELSSGQRLLDQSAFQAGMRDIRLDPVRGLLLNGAPYAVHGVNVHQTYLPGKGPAVTDADIDADYRILSDLGVTGLRHAHYQHPQHALDLADRLGWLVWTEMPLNAEVDGGAEFLANSVQQLRELIRQNRNHAAVTVWGLGNEIYKVDAASARVLALMQRIAQREDPARPTVYANCCVPVDGPQASHTDAVGSNVYYGWYDGEFADLGPFLDGNRMRRPTTPLAVSEYGAGGSPQQQQDPPQRPLAGGRWHPEQYQALYHEAAWRQLEERPWLWGKFVWVGFDFPSAGRNEGDQPGFNDKGLVSFDRTVKKDAYFWYQANWTDGATRPMVYITSRRHTQRTAADVEIKVYSNQATARLAVNGVDWGERPVIGHVATWPGQLAPGANRVSVTAGSAADTVVWELIPAPSRP
ncbi:MULTISPECIES: glycoside hydrolase family 2 protein [unclassified Duganella]|uniref:glycoside hydrolase family 2 protein n=1 Tax=unclassified Duganella TaxID=2636909 RepID=UPI000E34D514|nr:MULTISPECIES: glycoside hydrolase family 2 TIM barrel-domain containing protein [unclassified Duganella]RFP19220.1 glycoside hydrolase family 2 protein [Duganella sp. BJB475]RFP35801.1 glycoside hydrolase family 2 protein [Duganella sp. BJB476]